MMVLLFAEQCRLLKRFGSEQYIYLLCSAQHVDISTDFVCTNLHLVNSVPSF